MNEGYWASEDFGDGRFSAFSRGHTQDNRHWLGLSFGLGGCDTAGEIVRGVRMDRQAAPKIRDATEIAQGEVRVPGSRAPSEICIGLQPMRDN